MLRERGDERSHLGIVGHHARPYARVSQSG